MISAPGVILSFDDHFVEQWFDANGLFAKYDAHVTFFVSEFDKLSDSEVEKLILLERSGHCIGVHGLRHRDAVKTIDEIGIEGYVSQEILPELDMMRRAGINSSNVCFAYPVSSRDERTDSVLFRFFRYLRYGIAQKDWLSVPMKIDSIGRKGLIRSISIDENGGLPLEKIEELLSRIKEANSVVAFYSHSIQDEGIVNRISHKKLETILQLAYERELHLYSFAEL